MDGKREYWIDLTRCFACICVLITHAPIAIQEGKAGLSAVAVYNISAVGGGSILFFMITGALVLTSSSTQNFSSFMTKRLSRVVFPMIFWSVIYLLFDWLCFHQINSEKFIHSLVSIPFAPQVGVFWFIYAVLAIYLLAPVLSYWLRSASQNTVKIYIGIFLLTLIIPYVGYYFVECKMPLADNGYLQYFNGFLGFALLGYYLRRWPLKVFSLGFVMFLLFAVSIPVIGYGFSIWSHTLIQDRQTINAASLAIIYFTILQHVHIPQRIAPYIEIFSRYTFGVYLSHFIILRHVVWPILAPLNMNYIYGIPVTVLVTLSLSLLVVYIFAKLPFHKYTVSL